MREERAVLFDLDGTLINTQPLIFASYRYAVQKVLGYEASDESIEKTVGKTLRQGLKLFSTEKLDQLVETYRRHNIENHREFVQPFAGAREALRALRMAGGRVGIVTSKRRDVGLLGLRICGLLGYPEIAVFEEDAPLHKPYPHPLWLGCRRLGAAPASTVYVGDGPVDMAAARAAGLLPVAVGWSGFAKSELKAAGAEVILEEWDELLTILGLEQGEGFPAGKGNLFSRTYRGRGGEGVCAG